METESWESILTCRVLRIETHGVETVGIPRQGLLDLGGRLQDQVGDRVVIGLCRRVLGEEAFDSLSVFFGVLPLSMRHAG